MPPSSHAPELLPELDVVLPFQRRAVHVEACRVDGLQPLLWVCERIDLDRLECLQRLILIAADRKRAHRKQVLVGGRFADEISLWYLPLVVRAGDQVLAALACVGTGNPMSRTQP